MSCGTIDQAPTSGFHGVKHNECYYSTLDNMPTCRISTSHTGINLQLGGVRKIVERLYPKDPSSDQAWLAFERQNFAMWLTA